jgi:hypothetical protein
MAKKKPRKPLARKTPLKRSDKPLKRTPMNKISPKERKKLAGIRDARKAYRETHPYCVICGAFGSTVHEVTSGTFGRAKGVVEPAVWLPVCVTCNCRVLDDHKLWPKEMQMAVKLVLFPDEFDLEKANACYIGTFSMAGIEGYIPEVRRRLGLERAA